MKLPELRVGATDIGRFGHRFVVAGNGPSLANLDPGQINGDDTIIRVNSFFFEPEYFLGRRVDILQLGGDRWIFPFYKKTLVKALESGLYELGHWSCHQEHVAAHARQKLGSTNQVELCFRDEAICDFVVERCKFYDKLPTTGIYALINAHALGAKEITLAGIDFYTSSEKRYAYENGPRNSALLSGAASQGYNRRVHAYELDLDIVRYLAGREDVTLFRTTSATSALYFLDMAPNEYKAAGTRLHKPQGIHDLEGWVGPYPIGLMRFLRRVREIQLDLKSSRK